jgi:hypothetical protein
VTAQSASGRRKSSEPAVILRGPPTRLSASRPLPADVASVDLAPLAASAVSMLIKGAVPERVRVRGGRTLGAVPELRVRLAPSTPPGRYEGAASVGARTVPVVIEVEPAPRLRATPSRLETVAEAGGSEAVEIHLANSGNLPIEIPSRSSFCLFDGGGLDHAVWTALTTDPPEGKGRMDMLLDDLAASHGGLVDVRVRDGAGSIAPGERRTCRVELRWSDRLRPGRRYAGAWEVAGLRLPIRVETPRVRPSGAKASTTSRRAR